MIKTFKNKQLAALWSGKATKIDARFHKRLLVRLDRLNVCLEASEMNVPGYNFHTLQGFKPIRYTVHVNGPMCITFEFDKGDAYAVNFENYH